MLQNRLKFCAILLLGLLLTGLQAQESINASGGDATGSGGSIAYSIGQVVYTTNTGSSGSLAQGVQQAYKILPVGVDETASDISIGLFPNPTTDILTLQISHFNNEKLSYQLYDMQGKFLCNKEITARQTLINMYNLPAATYFVCVVFHENQKTQSFKIVKIN